MGESLRASIIIPCKNEGHFLKQTLDIFLRTEAVDDNNYEIIVVNDGSTDGCCDFFNIYRDKYMKVKLITTEAVGPASARNIGAAEANGDIYVFCDGHLLVRQGWLEGIVDTFSNKEIGAVSPAITTFDLNRRAGYGMTWDKNLEVLWLYETTEMISVPILPGGCLAIKKDIFEDIGGFDRGFTSYGYEDAELSIKLWLFGYKAVVNPNIKIGHHFRKVAPYKVDLNGNYYNKLRMAINHLSEQRIIKLLQNIPKNIDGEEVLRRFLSSDSLVQREEYFRKRKYGDDWFFEHFGIDF